MEERPYKVGDHVAITPATMNRMKDHCHKSEIPTSNHGIVESVIRPNDKNEHGAPLHPYVYTTYEKYDYVTVKLGDESIGFLENALMLLY